MEQVRYFRRCTGKAKRLCEVKIVDETGKRHKLQVDVQTNQVVKAK